MTDFRLAWAAFKNMLRAAARDPLWAIIAIVTSPLRAAKLAYYADPEFKGLFDKV